MSVAELAKTIGQVGTLSVEVGNAPRWRVSVRVVDCRQVWGKTQYQVEPVGSEGSPVWVEEYRVHLAD